MRLTLDIGLSLILVVLVASPPGADAAILDGLKRVTGNAWELFGSLTRAKVPANLPENPSTLHNTGVVSTVLPDANNPLRFNPTAERFGTALPDANNPLRVRPTREPVAEGLPLQPGSHVIEQDVDSVNFKQQGTSKFGLLQGVQDVLLRQKGEQTIFDVGDAYRGFHLRQEDFAGYKQLSPAANERIAAVRIELIEAYPYDDSRYLVTGRAIAEEQLVKAIGMWRVGSDARAEMFRSLGNLHASVMGHGIRQGRASALEMRSTELRVAADLSTAAASIDNLQPATRQWYFRMAVKIVEREQRKLNRMFYAAKSAGAISDQNVLNFLRQRDKDVRYLTGVLQEQLSRSKDLFVANHGKLPKFQSWRSAVEEAYPKPTPREQLAQAIVQHPLYRTTQQQLYPAVDRANTEGRGGGNIRVTGGPDGL